MRKRPTPRQIEIARFIREYATREHWPPRLEDIGAHFAITFQAASQHLTALIDLGIVERAGPGRIRVIGPLLDAEER